MFPKHQSNYTFYQNSGALLIAIFGALSVADYTYAQTSLINHKDNMGMSQATTQKSDINSVRTFELYK